MKKISILFILLSSLLLLAVSCKKESSAKKGPITIASKIDTEGALLGQIMVIVLEKNGFSVIDKTEFGPTNIIRKAIINGEIDLYPEYTGNGGFFFDGTDPQIWKNADLGYETVKKMDREQNNLVWLTPAKANNTWAIAIRQDLADQEDLNSLEDLARYLNQGGYFKLACSEEFVQRPDTLPAFQKAYGFKLKDDQLLTFSGGNTAQTEKAAADKTDGVNAAMAYGTDGAISALKLKVLTDTLSVQPVYLPAPLLRNEIHTQYQEIESLLAPVFQALTLEKLQKLNSQIAIEGIDAAEVARNFLNQEQLLD